MPTGMLAEHMGDREDRARRKIVLHPRTAAARRIDRRRSYGSNVRGFTVENDEVFAMVDEQRRAAVRYLVVVVVPILLILASFVFLPGLTDKSVRGVPLPWILMGPTALFSVVFVAWRHDRRALRIERSWAARFEEKRR